MSDNFKKEYAGSMDSKYYFSSDRLRAGKIGATASPQTPNQIGELTSRLNQGLKAVEIGAMNQRLLDQVPLTHFKEMKRMNILTGSEATLHAPIQDMDLAGFSQQGWSEFNRKESVEKLKSSIDRAKIMDIKGNIPITVHAGGFPVQSWQKSGLHGQWEKEGVPTFEIEEGKSNKTDARSEMMIVNRDTGQIQNVRYDTKEYISGEKQAWTPERRLSNLNRTSWDQEQLQLLEMKKNFNEMQDRFNRLYAQEKQILQQAEEKKLLTKEEEERLEKLDREAKNVQQYRTEIHSQTRSMAEEMYSRYNKYKTETRTEQQKELEERFKKNMVQVKKMQEELERIETDIAKTENKIMSAKDLEEKNKLREEYFGKISKLNDMSMDQTEILVRNFENMQAPKTWISADDFAKEKVSNSITEAALYAYKEYGEKAPIISMENVYPEFALSRADSLKETVEKAKSQFTEALMKKEKISQKKAEEIANKIIGVTWDVGHIYMLKKHGYTDEDIKKEAEKIGKHVTHIHLTDNFGFEDSHLPPGLGKVNIKEQLEAIEKSMDDEKKGKIKSIVEAGEFVANFKEIPHLYALANLNSPLYTDDVGPKWDDIWDTHGNYMAGFGEIMPQKYFDLYGAPGFAQLPRELGGSAGSPEKGRFASTQGEEQ